MQRNRNFVAVELALTAIVCPVKVASKLIQSLPSDAFNCILKL